jgi:hypothetical protein
MHPQFRCTRNIRESAIVCALACMVCIAAFCGDEVWNTKSYDQWTPEEATKVLTSSPWAKQGSVSYDASGVIQRNGGDRMSPGGRRGGIALPLGGSGLPGGAGIGRGSGERGTSDNRQDRSSANAPPPKLLVRWESAKPIKDALARVQTRDPAQAPTTSSDGDTVSPEEAEDYIIAVVGLPLPGSKPNPRSPENAGGSETSHADGSLDDRALAQLMSSTKLIREGKRDPLVPEDIKLNTNSGASEIYFLFAKTTVLSLDDKEVTFVTQLGRIKVACKFTAKDMSYQGRLAL